MRSTIEIKIKCQQGDSHTMTMGVYRGFFMVITSKTMKKGILFLLHGLVVKVKEKSLIRHLFC